MSKNFKIALIAAGVAVAGMILAAVGFAWSGGDVGSEHFELVDKSFPANKIDCSSPSLGSDDVHLSVTDGDEITLSYYDNGRGYYEVSLDGGELKIKRNVVRGRWYENIRVGFGETCGRVEIGLPEKYSGELELHAGSGDIELDGVSTIEALSVAAGSGSVSLENVSCLGDISVSTSSGELRADGLEARSFRAESSSGDVELADVSCQNEMEIKASSGDITLDGCTADEYRLRASSGDISVADGDFESAELETTSGDITARFRGGMEDYSIRSGTTSGDNTLPERLDGGDRRLDVTTTSGDISVYFDR